MKTCFIFGALPAKRIPVTPKEGDLIIAADKGIENIRALGLKPDIVIGDFDSLGYIPNEKEKIVLPVRKDDTDTGYAIKYALENGCDRLYVYGAIGGLLDHTAANIQLAASLAKKGIFAEFFGDDITVLCLTDGKVSFPKAKEGRFSVFALDKASGVTLCGLEYEVQGIDLDPLFPIGVSNAFKDEKSSVEVKNGTLLLMWQGDISAVPW